MPQIHHHEMECLDLLDVRLIEIYMFSFIFASFDSFIKFVLFFFSFLNFSFFSENSVSSQSSAHSNSSLGMNCATPGSDWKLRKPVVRSAQGSTTPEMHSRRHSGGVSSLHQSRSKQIHQSNGSIQSDSPSSNSISPAPSPSPRPQSVNTNNGSVGLGKRWNSTGDFNAQSALTGRYGNHIYSSMRSFSFDFHSFLIRSLFDGFFLHLNVIIIFY